MNSGTSIGAEPKARRKPVLFQVILIAGILALIWFSFGQNVLSSQNQSSVPKRIGALKLVDKVEGAAAVAEVSKLHGSDISLLTAYIATYTSGPEKLTAWIGKAASDTAAAELLNRMTAGISTNTSGFNNLKRLSITQGYHSHEVFQVDGPGGKHFFYISKLSRDKVIWLTIQSENAGSLLETAINTF